MGCPVTCKQNVTSWHFLYQRPISRRRSVTLRTSLAVDLKAARTFLQARGFPCPKECPCVPARVAAPRHRAPRSLRRFLNRAAQSATGALRRPRAAATLALLSAATMATGLGLYDASPGASEPEAGTPGRSVTAEVSAALARHATSPWSRQARPAALSEAISRSADRPPRVAVQRTIKSLALPVASQALSSPHTAGSAAVVIDAFVTRAFKTYTAEQVRSAIVNTAEQGSLPPTSTARLS